MAVTTYFAENTSRATTTSTSYTDHTTLTFTPNASKDHWLVWSGIHDVSGTATNDGFIRLFNSSDSLTYNEQFFEPKDLTDNRPVYGLKKYTSSASPASTVFKTQIRTNATSYTVGFQSCRIFLIEAGAHDQYVESDGNSNTTSATFQTKATLTFTPGSDGDYLIIATAEVNCSATTSDINVRLVYSGTNYSDAQIRLNDTRNYVPWGGIVKLTLAASSQTITIQFASDGTNTVNIVNARIVAIRLDAFGNSYYTEDRSRTTTTSGTPQDKSTLTQTPVAVEHAIFACHLADNSSSSVSANQKLVEDSTEIAIGIFEGIASAKHDPFFCVYRKTLSAVETTWKTQYYSETTSATTGSDESAIAILQTGAAGSTYNDTFALGMRSGLSLLGPLIQTGSLSPACRLGSSAFETVALAPNVSFTGRLGFAASALATLTPAIAMAVRKGLTPAGNLVIEAASSLDARLGYFTSVGFTREDTLSLVSRSGLSIAAVSEIGAAVSFNSRAGLGTSNIIVANDAILLGSRLLMGLSGNLSMAAAVILGSRLGILNAAGFLLEASVALGARAVFSVGGAADFYPSVTFTTATGVSVSGLLVLTPSIGLQGAFGLENSGALVIGATLSLDTRAGASLLGNFTAGESIALASALALQIAAALSFSDTVSLPVRLGFATSGVVTTAIPGVLTVTLSNAGDLTVSLENLSALIASLEGVGTLTITETP